MTPSFVELPNIILKSHETNDYHSSKVASVRLSCRRGTDQFLQSPFRVCVRLSDAPKEVCYSTRDSKENLSCYTINVFTVVTFCPTGFVISKVDNCSTQKRRR